MEREREREGEGEGGRGREREGESRRFSMAYPGRTNHKFDLPKCNFAKLLKKHFQEGEPGICIYS